MKMCYFFNEILLKCVSKELFNDMTVSIGSGNSLVQNKQKAIAWPMFTKITHTISMR